MQPNWDPTEDIVERYSDTKRVGINESGQLIVSEVDDSLAPEIEQVNLVSDVRKVVLMSHRAYFHILTEIIPAIVKEITEYLDEGPIQFVVLGDLLIADKFDTHHVLGIFDLVKKQLEARGHSIVFVSLHNGTKIVVNNFKLYKQKNSSLYGLKSVMDFLSDGVDKGADKPHRKIYLSRSKTMSNAGQHIGLDDFDLSIDGLRDKYKNQLAQRVDDPEKLGAYLETLGFETVVPEDISSYEDQIKLISEASKVISITSAALTSLMFMREGSTVIELATPLDTPRHPESQVSDFMSIHPHYFYLCFEFGISHVSIPHWRSADQIIRVIEETPGLKDFLQSE
jgi:hypothetical protein